MKAIAVDLDGTFLNDQHTFDELRFARLYKTLLRLNIKFIVASSNHSVVLKNYFETYDSIIYISQNGALLEMDERVINSVSIKRDDFNLAFSALIKNNYNFVATSVDKAYVPLNADENFIEIAQTYYPEFIKVSHFKEIEDDILNITVSSRRSKLESVRRIIPNSLTCVYSGGHCIDITGAVDKASMLKHLIFEQQISPDELYVFGDGENDISMMQLTKNSYAMNNADVNVKHHANFIAPSNNQSGVLEVIERTLNQ
ncbi:Cof-type HAD-IIB family hydrolase [Macrococcus armenti]|uniref:Cof-type HAD-IIB family hydrolase n=1 Tax=Macrococcus armenti TaxID=2875764 RepID=UPI001CC92FE9|nr:Cof-type HAD-IIB family hydrolase [Macrococcus armenti]UBH07591.1 HAD family hydrolase [Macrococcus armenti]UBH09824.1 HAD family hydrolase [Macrococcus armenti]UBH14367.1 HAD family hydrolase [Macrococcus armenti]UBH16727.1 HAD family hydrolase [Macrococcus armenti]UBH18990.1 HAD family hydrolase [Macrococcus armenti]